MQFSDTTSSNVYIITGDPSQATATSGLIGGMIFQLDIAAAAPGPTVSSVVNAFSFGSQLSPGALAAIFGANFGSGPASSVSVGVGGKPAYVLTVHPTQLNVQIPYEVSPGATTLTVTVNGAACAPFNLTLATYAPAISTVGGAGTVPATILTSKNVMVTPAAPASPGDNLTIFATGLGTTNPATPTGVVTAAKPSGHDSHCDGQRDRS